MSIKTMKDLYVDLLTDSYDSEHQIIEALPTMAEAAIEPELKQAFETHLAETKDQVKKLESVFQMLDMKPKRKTCEATKGLVEEAEELMDEDVEEGVLDAGLIACAQKVEHCEIASYGTLCELAKTLGFLDQQKVLHSILEQEKSTDLKLTKLAETRSNLMAKNAA